MVASYNYYYRAQLQLAKYEGGAKVTKTVDVTSKSLKDSASVARYWPILQSVGEITYAAGETLPTLTVGSIQIDNSVGSFGTGRKFSDLLQPGHYTAVEQPDTVYVAQVANDTDTVSSWTAVATGVVADWEAPVADGLGTLTFNVRPLKFDEKVLTLEANRSVSGMENAPDGSLGRAVPLILGDRQTAYPVRISADGATTPKYAWATCLYQHMKTRQSDGVVFYTKNYDDAWESIDGSGSSIPEVGGAVTGAYSINTYDAQAWRLDLSIFGMVVTGVRLSAKGNGSGVRVSTAFMDVFVLRVDAVTRAVVEDPMAKGTVDLSYYDAPNNAGTAAFDINVSFDRPAFLAVESGDYEYYLGFRSRNYTSGAGAGLNDLSLNYGATTAVEFRQDDSVTDTGGGGWRYAGPTNVPHHTMHVVIIDATDHVNAYTQSGLTYSDLTLYQFTPDTGQANPHFDTFALACVPTSGLVPYGGGATVDRPTTVTDLLGYVWDTATNAWEYASLWDLTTLDSTHYAYLYAGASTNYRSRSVAGVFDSKVTFAQVVAEVCRGTASRVGVFPDGKAFMYPWGVTVAPTFDIPFADVHALTWQQRDVSRVVNRCVINLGKNRINQAGIFSGDPSSFGFAYSTDFSAVNYPQVRAMTEESRAMYGNKDLANTNFPIYPYTAGGGYYMGLTAEDQGSVLAEYYLARFAKPLVYASFIVPWHRYSTLKMFDVITFSTPAFPAYYGTDADPRQNWVVDTGSAVTTVDVNSGYDLVQAQTYRGLIEGLSYVLAMEHAPALKLTVLVLQNYATDPT